MDVPGGKAIAGRSSRNVIAVARVMDPSKVSHIECIHIDRVARAESTRQHGDVEEANATAGVRARVTEVDGEAVEGVTRVREDRESRVSDRQRAILAASIVVQRLEALNV